MQPVASPGRELGGTSPPPVVLKTNFEIFLNLKRKVGGGGGGGGYDDSNF